MNEPLAIYIHWPFCAAKCPYCDFNSHVATHVDHHRWCEALLTELRTAAHGVQTRPVGSVFFGGGTPSLMEPETVARLIAEVKTLFPQSDAPEISMEANPGSLDAGRFAAFAGAGVGRLSLGVQSLDDDVLRFLGRVHDAKAAREAVALAARLFARYSFDLIYARPGQSLQDWRSELTDALTLAGDHLSVYQLTMEPGTAFYPRWQRGEIVLPDENLATAFYDRTLAWLAEAGLPAYEISNHARPGCESRHNLTYWRYGDYLGIGPGAHGRINATATRRHRAPEIWLDQVTRTGAGLTGTTALSAGDRVVEMMIMGLRLTEPVPHARLKALTGEDFFNWPARARMEDLIEAGDLVISEAGLASTSDGRRRLNGVLTYLLAPYI